MFAIYLETGSNTGVFTPSEVTEWLTDYIFSEEKSYCKLGSEVSWTGSTVSVAFECADECYIYFNYPSDLALTSMTLNGNPISSYPAQADNIYVNPTCTNADANWNYDTWNLEVDDMIGKVNCNIQFTQIASPPALASHIIDLYTAGVAEGEDDNTNSLIYTNSAEYRYYGLNPNNYIWYNDELWRIIGVFDDASHGQTGQNLVKIIREDLYTFVYATGNDNSWEESLSNASDGATLKTLYNTYYYNSTDGKSYVGCRINSSSITTNCDFTNEGLDADARSLVQTATWYLGGHSSTSVTAAAMYEYERGSTTSSGTSLTAVENIGLMYPSDYGYASPASCYGTNLSSYNPAACGGANWLLKNQYEFFITPSSSYTNSVFYLNYTGSVSSNNTSNGNGSRPVLYLKSTASYIGGSGTESDPIIVN